VKKRVSRFAATGLSLGTSRESAGRESAGRESADCRHCRRKRSCADGRLGLGLLVRGGRVWLSRGRAHTRQERSSFVLPPSVKSEPGYRNSIFGASSSWNATRAGIPAALATATNELASPMQNATPCSITSLAALSPRAR
jgi:hypothetical protein